MEKALSNFTHNADCGQFIKMIAVAKFPVKTFTSILVRLIFLTRGRDLQVGRVQFVWVADSKPFKYNR